MGELELTLDCTVHSQLSDLVQVAIEPIGKLFHEYERLKKNRSHNNHLAESDATDDSKSSIKEVDLDIDMEFLQDLDHRLWKNQDHYRVLGLQKYRYKASDKDIKKAYHQIMLLCHPDKKKGEAKEVLKDNSFLKNVKKAFDILGDPGKRRGYDSVDPLFEDEIPSEKAVTKSNFYRVYAPVFERNSRWSVKKNVPLLGDAFSSQEYVEHFYDFWYTFESWRDFSYEDEEKEGVDDKDERWYIDKQNKAERMSKMKKENGRIRKLIDTAYYVDPRIKKFRDEDREKKEAIKKAKKQEIYDRKQKGVEELKKKEEEEQRKKEEEELEAKAKQQREKKEKEAIKKELKALKKVWEELSKDSDYFVHDEGDRVQAMMDVDMLTEGLELLDLKDLIEDVKGKGSKLGSRKVIKEKVEDLKSGKIGNNFLAGVSTPVNRVNNRKQTEKLQEKAWSGEELQLLIKSVNLFPAGTMKRWEVVANYLSQHGPNKVTRPAKDVLNKAKQLQHADAQQLKDHAAADNLTQLGVDKKLAKLEGMAGSSVNATPTERDVSAPPTTWSAEEQTLLEQALKTFPASVPERWDKIAGVIPDRSKRDCMKRYKELAEMIKAKKAAMQAAGVKK